MKRVIIFSIVFLLSSPIFSQYSFQPPGFKNHYYNDGEHSVNNSYFRKGLSEVSVYKCINGWEPLSEIISEFKNNAIDGGNKYTLTKDSILVVTGYLASEKLYFYRITSYTCVFYTSPVANNEFKTNSEWLLIQMRNRNEYENSLRAK